MISRREFSRVVGAAVAATSLAACSSAPQAPPPRTSFASLKQIDAGLLNVGYAEDGPPDGPPVILLHGWPYDIHSYVDVAPLLAAQGFRVLVPYLRGYGSTRFLSDRHLPQRPTGRAGHRHHPFHGRAEDPEPPSSADSTGARAPPISSPPRGRNVSRRWSR